jgi:hypothetical protein
LGQRGAARYHVSDQVLNAGPRVWDIGFRCEDAARYYALGSHIRYPMFWGSINGVDYANGLHVHRELENLISLSARRDDVVKALDSKADKALFQELENKVGDKEYVIITHDFIRFANPSHCTFC